MSYFYAIERKKFEVKFDQFRHEAINAGMSEESIQAMYEFDLYQFNRDRPYIGRQLSLSDGAFGDEEEAEDDRSPLFKKYLEILSISMEKQCFVSSDAWMENLEDARLTNIRNVLSPEDIDFISHIAQDEISPAELSRKLGISRAAVSKRLKRIREKINKMQAQG